MTGDSGGGEPRVYERESLPGPDVVADRVGAVLDAAVDSVSELSGGEIGDVYRVDLVDGRRVVGKVSATPLSVEAEMLEYLGERGLPVPSVLHVDDDLLVLAYVPGDGGLTPAAQRDAARHLTALHDHTADAFGFHRDTLSGSLEQPNPWTDSWVAFFREHRLCWAVDVVREAGVVPDATLDRVTALAADLDDHLAEPDAPALLHGDVWTNNLVVHGGEVRAFLDPACYYGHPEVELAYATWAGFGDDFLDAYRERRGIRPGFDSRAEIYRLPDRLLHAWYFDPADYLPDVKRTLAGLGY